MIQRRVNEIQQKFHHLAQFLAAFSNSYLPRADDDSQSSLKWSTEEQALLSASVEGVYLSLGLKNMMLKAIKGTQIKALDVVGLTHDNIDHWLRTTIQSFGINSLALHYELGFELPSLFNNFTSLDSLDKKAISSIVNQRNIGQRALEIIQKESPMTASKIRVWPHHFDTGMLIDKSDKEDFSKGIGLGYSIADHVSQVPYYYVYAWSDREIDYSNLPTLKHSLWFLEEWKGAIITTNMRYNISIVTALYQEAVNCLEEII